MIKSEKIVKYILKTSILAVVARVLNLALIVILSNMLSSATFGLLVLMLAYSSLSEKLSTSGLLNFTNTTIHTTEELTAVLQKLFLPVITFGIIIIAALSYLQQSDLTFIDIIIICAITIVRISIAYMRCLFVYHKLNSQQIILTELAPTVTVIMLIAILLFPAYSEHNKNIQLLLGSFLASNFIAAFVSIIYLKKQKKLSNLKIPINFTHAIPKGKQSQFLTYYFLGLIPIATNELTLILASLFCTLEDVGTLRIALSISTFFALFQSTSNQILLPKLRRLSIDQKTSDMQNQISLHTQTVTITMTILIFVFILFGKLILFYIHEDILQIYYASLIMLIGQLISAVCGPVGLVLNIMGMQNKTLFANIFGVALIIIFIPIMTYNFSTVGASIGVSLVLVLINAIRVSYVHKILGIRTWIHF